MKKKEGNLLDLIPERNCQWGTSENGKIYLQVPRFRNRFMKSIALRLGKSEFVKIHYDELGSKTWQLIDGKNSVERIGELLEKEMGSAAQPVYQRLTEFLLILSRNKFIQFKNY